VADIVRLNATRVGLVCVPGFVTVAAVAANAGCAVSIPASKANTHTTAVATERGTPARRLANVRSSDSSPAIRPDTRCPFHGPAIHART
jgi:hypothetical protein